MDLAKLIVKNLLRHKLRTILTVLGIAIAILSFGMIRTVIAMWYSGVEASSPNRLITRNAISLIFPLPIAYRNAITAVPGVSEVSYAQWFGGIYIDEKHSQFPQVQGRPGKPALGSRDGRRPERAERGRRGRPARAAFRLEDRGRRPDEQHDFPR
jgi:hypothetical protein